MKSVLKHYLNTRVLQGVAPAPNPPPQKMLCQKPLQRQKMIARAVKNTPSAQFHFKC